MSRPSREWVRKTYTVSPEVEIAIGSKASELGIDAGTVIDILVWDAMLKPPTALRKPGMLSNEVLERMFAEEVIPLLDDDEVIKKLAHYSLSVSSREGRNANLQAVRSLVKRWRRTRRVEKEYQIDLVTGLGDTWEPTMLRDGLVTLEWFQPE